MHWSHIHYEDMRSLVLALALALMSSTSCGVSSYKLTEKTDFTKLRDRSVLYPAAISKGLAPSYHNRRAASKGTTSSSRGMAKESNTFEPRPSIVALYIDQIYFCAGTIITSEWIVTSAHCTDFASSFEVWGGKTDLRLTEPNEQYVTAIEHLEHYGFDPDTLAFDVALIRLFTPFVLNDHVSPIPLAAFEPPGGERSVATGWGHAMDNLTQLPLFNVLTDATRFIVPDSEVPDSEENIYLQSLVCAYQQLDPSHSCNTDSGGPLYLTYVSVNGRESNSLLGVAAMVPSHLECAKGMTLVCFTSVPVVADWIKNHTQEDDDEDGSGDGNGETGAGEAARANAIVALLTVSLAYVLT